MIIFLFQDLPLLRGMLVLWLLLQPPTEKLHHIMARTAIFVHEHGGQSEIVLRVKQGDNPTFGFLMPDHNLHPYFRFLVGHSNLLKTDMDPKAQEKEKRPDIKQNQTPVSEGALSMLGSVYGSGEDDDGAVQVVSESKGIEPESLVHAVDMTFSHGLKQAESSASCLVEDKTPCKDPFIVAKAKAPSYKSTRYATKVTAGTADIKRREADTFSSPSVVVDKPQSSPPSVSEVEALILEPPSFLKRMIDRIVDFILRNGKEFEAILIEQDSTNGRFPFLLPANQYHPYYLRVLQNAQESKLPGKSQKHDSLGLMDDNKKKVRETAMLKGGEDALSKESVGVYETERKEKFKMVIGGLKKDSQEPLSKSSQRQCGMSVDEAAAIIFAATRGPKNSKSGTFSKTSLDDSDIGDGARTPSIGSLSFPLHTRNGSISKPVSNGERGISMPSELSKSVGQKSSKGGRTSNVLVAKAIAKTAALAAASEADSSEASLTREQKQKAERLKRAKMFASMIKNGGRREIGSSPRLSEQAPHSALSDSVGSGCKATTNNDSAQAATASNLSGAEFAEFMFREREGSSVPVEIDVSDRLGKSGKKDSDNDCEGGWKSRKKHSSKHRGNEEDDLEKDHKHSRKKRRSEHSLHSDRDERKRRKSHSSSKDGVSRHRHKHHDSASEDEHRHKSRSSKHRGRSHAERKREIDDDEVHAKLSDHSNNTLIEVSADKEASAGLSNDLQGGAVADTRSSGAMVVSDDLRAKVRAMLLATM
eukprot:TRINITY_DN5780_c0_g1_i2.p1 TRINITY_DN5780_c0_g1~~TRINITY_DN5780_c0_g1_i2.p1  ORF type:complete len:761 (-),score=183.11 TRINITY_DN5780_c0_g1_i2:382-2664(-)